MNERRPVGQHRAVESAGSRKSEAGKPAKLSREVQARLGQQLRAMYDEVLNQGVPDRFKELVTRIEESDNKDGQP
jgi:hypothetical protein